MKRYLSVFVGMIILLSGLSLGAASAMTSNNTGGGTCTDSGYPAAYTGGAGVAKYFHLSDGSTVTITDTGAVIKQSPCHTAYREGWINTSGICDIQSAQDLNGHLSSGSSNPYGSTNFTSCSNNTQSSSVQQRTQTSTPAAAPQATATANATANVNVNSPPAVKAATTTAAVQPTSTVVTQPTSAPKTLPNTGPGNILMLSGATSAVGTIGHWYYSRRSRRQR